MKVLFDGISDIKEEYESFREKNRFNVITAMHKERDEVNLHSRIISYLLSPSSGHGMKEAFLKIFIRDTLKIDEDKFELNNITVIPNESNKTEYEEIDILIVNRTKRQAIIIENKIDANDSNHLGYREGYKGQLERYYKTIKTGEDNNKKPCLKYKSDHIYVYYLSMRELPKDFSDSIGMLKYEPISWGDNHILAYDSHIREWLSKCLDIVSEKEAIVKTFIQHYLNLLNKMTNNDLPLDERSKLKKMVSENISTSKYLIDNFKHVKWHTVDAFWTQLKNQLRLQFGIEAKYYPNERSDFEKIITTLTHQEKSVNHGLIFWVNGVEAYISGERILTWGLVDPKKWTNFRDENVAEINFSDFTSENTFQLINEECMMEVIEEILVEIKESADINFKNLQSDD